MKLVEQKCVACEGNITPFNKTEAEVLLKQIPKWKLTDDNKTISKKYILSDFVSALDFVNKVGEIAESEGHHPDIHLIDYKHVRIELTTHVINGLSQNDFILAAKIDL